MHVESGDAHIVRLRERRTTLEVIDRYAELRCRSTGADMRMMTTPDTGIDPQEQRTTGEDRTPLKQRMQVVERELHPESERPLVLVPGREIGGEEDLRRRQIRKHLEGMLDLTA